MSLENVREMRETLEFEAGSYRDWGSRVFSDDSGHIFRALSQNNWTDWLALEGTAFFSSAVESGCVVRTQAASNATLRPAGCPEPCAGVLQHERVPFISYPFEWPFGMLQDAALLQLELLAAALKDGFTLKDGWAYNVQWLGTRPLFIDIGSFERLDQPRPWAGYRQFCQTLLYPLMLQAYKNIPFHPWLRGRLDGITPQEMRQFCSLRDLYRRGVWSHVVLHAWLDSSQRQTDGDTAADLSAAGFRIEMLEANLRGLTNLVRNLRWSTGQSPWSDYDAENTYTDADQQAKADFVRTCLQARRGKLAWDLGCNTGRYARLAAEYFDYVIAMDADHAAVEKLYRALKLPEQRQVLPLVADVADQTQGLGWRGRERSGLAARGRPDVILCLALVHHLVIGRGIPLPDLMAWFAELGADLIVEFVDQNDPMVQRLLSRRRDKFDYGRSAFEHALQQQFEVERRISLPMGTRTIYFARPRTP